MRWKEGRRSENVEDRRGMRAVRTAGLGGLGILVVAGIALLLGADPRQVLQVVLQAPSGQSTSSEEPQADAAAPGGYDEQADFASVILADTEDTWTRLFTDQGQRYEPPRLVLFSEAVESACGFSSSAVGPFYCPVDSRMYLDLSFFNELDQRFDAPGDFARAYVIAHEIGHHVQNVVGISDKVQDLQSSSSREAANELSVRLELQADCLAGVWAHYADTQRQLLEPGDIEEGLRAAAAIGDDVLQRSAGARVTPETWTHGSAEQRARWFKTGLDSGDLQSCNTL